MIYGMSSLDNVALIDFCGAKLHYFAQILGCIMPMSSVSAILWDTHTDSLGSLWLIRKLRSSFRTQKRNYFDAKTPIFRSSVGFNEPAA